MFQISAGLLAFWKHKVYTGVFCDSKKPIQESGDHCIGTSLSLSLSPPSLSLSRFLYFDTPFQSVQWLRGVQLSPVGQGQGGFRAG